MLCWGAGDEGQLGSGSADASLLAKRVAGIDDALSVESTSRHSCALLVGGTVKCWGTSFGGFGDGDGSARLSPVSVPGVTNAVELQSSDAMDCVRHTGGTVSCWGLSGGFSAKGQLGDGTGDFKSDTPRTVSGLADATSLAVSWGHSCAVRATGAVVCWGANLVGQLGNGTKTDAAVPVTVPGISDAVQVTAGQSFTCALRATGAVLCWGTNFRDVLGRPYAGLEQSLSPLEVPGVATATQLASTSSTTCATLADHTVRCWGENGYGTLGNGVFNGPLGATSVSGLTNATSVAADDLGHTFCAARSDRSAVCWGSGENGQLGNQGLVNRNVPVTAQCVTVGDGVLPDDYATYPNYPGYPGYPSYPGSGCTAADPVLPPDPDTNEPTPDQPTPGGGTGGAGGGTGGAGGDNNADPQPNPPALPVTPLPPAAPAPPVPPVPLPNPPQSTVTPTPVVAVFGRRIVLTDLELRRSKGSKSKGCPKRVTVKVTVSKKSITRRLKVAKSADGVCGISGSVKLTSKLARLAEKNKLKLRIKVKGFRTVSETIKPPKQQ